MKRIILCVFMTLLSFSSYAQSTDIENEKPKKNYSDFLDPNYYSKQRKTQVTNIYTGLMTSLPTIETISEDANAKSNNSVGLLFGVKANEYVGFEFGYKSLNSDVSNINRQETPIVNYKGNGKITVNTASLILFKNISAEKWKKYQKDIFISYGTGSYSSKYSGTATQEGYYPMEQDFNGSGRLTRIAVGMDIKFKETFYYVDASNRNNNGTETAAKIRINFYKETVNDSTFSDSDISDEDYISTISGLEFGLITGF